MWDYLVLHATPVETAFSIISLLSAIVSTYALRDAYIDSAILTAAKINGPRRAIADNNLHQEQLRFAIAVVMVMTSVAFLFLEPPPPEYTLLPQSLIGLVAWIVVATMLMVSSIIDKQIRKKLQKYAPLEVQTQSKMVAAPPVPEGSSRSALDDVVKAAEDAREEQRAEDAQHKEPNG